MAWYEPHRIRPLAGGLLQTHNRRHALRHRPWVAIAWAARVRISVAQRIVHRQCTSRMGRATMQIMSTLRKAMATLNPLPRRLAPCYWMGCGGRIRRCPNRQARPRANQTGMTLVEMALVVALVGLLAFLFLPMGRVMQEQAKIKETRAKLDAIEAAMVRYVMLHERLPCPANGTLADDNTNAGVELINNTTNTGCQPIALQSPIVPWRALGLTADDAVDAWGTRITYRPWMTTVADRSLTLAALTCGNFTDTPFKKRPARTGSAGDGGDEWDTLLNDPGCEVSPPPNPGMNPGHRVCGPQPCNAGGAVLADPQRRTTTPPPGNATGAAYVLIATARTAAGAIRAVGSIWPSRVIASKTGPALVKPPTKTMHLQHPTPQAAAT